MSSKQKFQNNGESICWIYSQAFKYAFLLPLVVTMVVNIIVFILILYRVIFRRERLTSTMSDRKLHLRQLCMAVCVFILLGFTWIFGLLAMSTGHLLFSYLFCIFNTLQGFLIFVFLIYRGEDARKLWKDFLSILYVYRDALLLRVNQTSTETTSTEVGGISNSTVSSTIRQEELEDTRM